MPFDPEAIARLSPAARVEVQDFYARKFLAEREARQPERRASRHGAAPASPPAPQPTPLGDRTAWRRVWFRNDSSRPTSAMNQFDVPVRAGDTVRSVSRNVPE